MPDGFTDDSSNRSRSLGREGPAHPSAMDEDEEYLFAQRELRETTGMVTAPINLAAAFDEHAGKS